MWAQIITIFLGLWLMAAPAILSYGDPAAASDRFTGPFVVSFAVVALWEATRGVRLANFAASAWLLIAPWVLGYSGVALWNSLVVAGALFFLTPIARKTKHRFGGGWRALVKPVNENS